jgi:putative methyltransferase (TIGR04325 family)
MNPYARRIVATGVRAAAHVRFLRGPLQLLYGRYFNSLGGRIRLFSGIYPDFKTAIRAIPPRRLTGFDNAPSARRQEHDLFHVFLMDYPVMFWLSRLLPDCRLLFDWGGNIGISYFAFRRHLPYPAQLNWLVNDVPAVVAEGLATKQKFDSPGLSFTTSMARLSEADILLAAGSLHFIEAPFDVLCAHKALPRHVLLNKVPVYSQASAVTLQNMGTALVANHLFNETQFVGNFLSLGYRMVDEWETGLSCHIPFHPEHSVHTYKGYYFSKQL